MELIELENIANREKIDIINFKMNKTKARIINYIGSYIFMDYSKIDTYAEEKCLLAEEIGHYYYEAYYTLNSSQENIDRQEYKALKWKSLACVPLNSILSCFKNGICNLFDIAQELQVDPNMIEFAYNYYKENNMLFTNEEMLENSI
jgi:hypothetical protein